VLKIEKKISGAKRLTRFSSAFAHSHTCQWRIIIISWWSQPVWSGGGGAGESGGSRRRFSSDVPGNSSSILQNSKPVADCPARCLSSNHIAALTATNYSKQLQWEEQNPVVFIPPHPLKKKKENRDEVMSGDGSRRGGGHWMLSQLMEEWRYNRVAGFFYWCEVIFKLPVTARAANPVSELALVESDTHVIIYN
jgi:hypothetical protein